MKEQLDRIAELTVQLNALVDAAMDEFDHLEKFFAEQSVRIYCSVPINEIMALEFCSHRSRFKFVVSDGTLTPLNNCSRATKLAAYKVLPALTAKLVKTIEELIESYS